jgi:hypothetical protein
MTESLFDKDLVKKDLTIRDVYDLVTLGRGVSAYGFSIGQMFNVGKVSKYPNPYTNYHLSGINSLDHLIGIIMDQPIPTKSNIKTSDHKWCENLKKILTKYVGRNWKDEWDKKKKKIKIYLIEYPDNYFGVNIDFDNSTGGFEFTFKPIS